MSGYFEALLVYVCAIVFPLSTVLFGSSVGAHMGIIKCPMWALSITLMSITCPHGCKKWDPFVPGIRIGVGPFLTLLCHLRVEGMRGTWRLGVWRSWVEVGGNSVDRPSLG